MFLYNDRGQMIAQNIIFANTFMKRFKGLMGTTDEQFGYYCAMVFDKCKSIHTCFMEFPLDILYLDKKFNLIGISLDVQPWRMDNGPKKSYYCIELKAGTLSGQEKQVFLR